MNHPVIQPRTNAQSATTDVGFHRRDLQRS